MEDSNNIIINQGRSEKQTKSNHKTALFSIVLFLTILILLFIHNLILRTF